jgi:hypothetical protein
MIDGVLVAQLVFLPVASVAQLDRASDFGSEGCRFKSCRMHHFIFSASLKVKASWPARAGERWHEQASRRPPAPPSAARSSPEIRRINRETSRASELPGAFGGLRVRNGKRLSFFSAPIMCDCGGNLPRPCKPTTQGDAGLNPGSPPGRAERAGVQIKKNPSARPARGGAEEN